MNKPVPGEGSNPGSSGFMDRGGAWVIGQFVWMSAIAASGGWYPGTRPGSWAIGVGLALAGMGGWIGILGALQLGKNRTAYPKPLAQGELIVTGIYGWVRHPLYTSLILLGSGWSLGRWSGLAGISTLGLALFLDAKARREEAWLERVYPRYGEYRRQVRRFVPGIY